MSDAEMDRRQAIKSLAASAAAVALSATACAPNNTDDLTQLFESLPADSTELYPPIAERAPKPALPLEFSAARLHKKLDTLLAAFEAKGEPVSGGLLPALTESEVRERCAWFPYELPEEIVALYTWRGGQTLTTWDIEHPFVFRDNGFANLDVAEQVYEETKLGYAGTDMASLLEHCFPFAELDGSIYSLPSREQSLDRRLARPVISAFEGVDVFFNSIENMVDTCIEWVEHPDYGQEEIEYLVAWQSIERTIWRFHNPGLDV